VTRPTLERLLVGAVLLAMVSILSILVATGNLGVLSQPTELTSQQASASHAPGETRAPTLPPTITPTVVPPTLPPTGAPTVVPPTAAPPAVLVGAGDIASCSSSGDEATATLLDGIAGTVFTLGDNAYDSGTASEFASCYDPTWGRHKARTKPAPGNHDYSTSGASGYYGYFGAAAGDPSRGYYAYDLGAWRIYALNSNCGAVGCRAGSAQEQWLRRDLAANPRACTLAYWHHPRFSSGPHGSSTATSALWKALQDAGVELVLAGHDHLYERFAPQSPSGASDANGIVEFVVGTGGRSHYEFGTILASSLVRNSTAFGVLRLELGPSGYAFDFVPVAGKSFTDSGSGTCH
jgi:hypothetical protein